MRYKSRFLRFNWGGALSKIIGTLTGVGTAFYAVQRFIALYPMNPGHKRVDAVHGDESPDAIKSGPYLIEGFK